MKHKAVKKAYKKNNKLNIKIKYNWAENKITESKLQKINYRDKNLRKFCIGIIYRTVQIKILI
jgi:hypothetical protein